MVQHKHWRKGMNTKVKLALAASLMLGGAGLLAGPASAMPISGLNKAVTTSVDAQKGVEDVRWFCRPWGCHWAPGHGYGGWRWHHWHHWHH
jgi:hypothetical protein